MELTPWKSFGEMAPFKREMDRLWNQFFGEETLGEVIAKEWFPPLNVIERQDKLQVEVELPGLEASNVDVNLNGDILTIKGSKQEEHKDEDKFVHRYECHAGSFERSIRLPASVMADKIDARFDKGVLRITLPKTAEAKQRDIKIKVH